MYGRRAESQLSRYNSSPMFPITSSDRKLWFHDRKYNVVITLGMAKKLGECETILLWAWQLW